MSSAKEFKPTGDRGDLLASIKAGTRLKSAKDPRPSSSGKAGKAGGAAEALMGAVPFTGANQDEEEDWE